MPPWAFAFRRGAPSTPPRTRRPRSSPVNGERRRSRRRGLHRSDAGSGDHRQTPQFRDAEATQPVLARSRAQAARSSAPSTARKKRRHSSICTATRSVDTGSDTSVRSSATSSAGSMPSSSRSCRPSRWRRQSTTTRTEAARVSRRPRASCPYIHCPRSLDTATAAARGAHPRSVGVEAVAPCGSAIIAYR